MNDLDLPPRKELPDDVHDRLRATVNAGTEAPRDPLPKRSTRPAPFRRPLAVAAAVAVLAAGAVLVGQAVNGTHDNLTVGNPTVPTDELLDEATMDATLDRCLPVMAITKDRPAPDDWRPVIGQRTMTEGVVVTARAGDAYMACQTTPNSVHVSQASNALERDIEPPYLLLSSFDGVIVGVADPTWGRVGVYVTGKDSALAYVAATKDGVFVLNAEVPAQDPKIRVYRADEGVPPVEDMTPVEARLGGGARIDRPNVVTEADKTLLGSCVAATPALEGNWTPGAAVSRDNGNRYLLARDGARIAVCIRYGTPVDGREYTLTDLGTHTSQGFAPCPIGLTPDGSLLAAVVAPEATNVELDYGPYEIVHGPVTNGTYLASTYAGKAPAWAVVHTENTMMYNGPPAC